MFPLGVSSVLRARWNCQRALNPNDATARAIQNSNLPSDDCRSATNRWAVNAAHSWRSGHDEWHRSLRDVVGLLSSELDRDRDVVVSKDDVPWEVARSRIRPLEPFPVMKLKRDPHVTSTRRLSPAMELLVQLNDPTAVVPDLDESVRLALQAEIRQRRRAPALLVVQRVGAPLQMIQEDQREHRWWHDDQKHPLPRDMCSAPHWMAQFDYPNAATYVPVKRSSSAAPIRNRTVQ